eukprot:TRINITY_DN4874_c1_g1_i3.p1 TRINITY_DN4874_c1_g1~~TRINITY_DN4874_c1_g1_i3.p1  ORF type:complete len:583 (+),score=58.03 TRINITY_DN4874_c1_g1_i3:167-1750(+)
MKPAGSLSVCRKTLDSTATFTVYDDVEMLDSVTSDARRRDGGHAWMSPDSSEEPLSGGRSQDSLPTLFLPCGVPTSREIWAGQRDATSVVPINATSFRARAKTAKFDLSSSAASGGPHQRVWQPRVRKGSVTSTMTYRVSEKDIPPGFRGSVYKIVKHPLFEICAMLVVVVNIVVVGAQTDSMARSVRTLVPDGFVIAETFCCVFFLLEVGIRILGDWRDFFRGPGRVLNSLDLGLAVLQSVEVMMTTILTGSVGDRAFNFAIMRALRLVRLIRLARIVRVFRLFADLRSTVLAIILCFRSLAGALVILFFVIYIFAIFFTEIALNDRIDLDEDDARRAMLDVQFGSMQLSMETLFVSITGGVDWYDIAASLNAFGRVVYYVYVIFSTLGMFNVITSVFVESTKTRVEHDRMSCLYACAEKIFKSCRDQTDNNKSTMSLEALRHTLRTNTEVAHLIESLRLTKDDVENIFNLLDRDGLNAVNVDLFVATLKYVGEPARRLEQTMMVTMLSETIHEKVLALQSASRVA